MERRLLPARRQEQARIAGDRHDVGDMAGLDMPEERIIAAVHHRHGRTCGVTDEDQAIETGLLRNEMLHGAAGAGRRGSGCQRR